VITRYPGFPTQATQSSCPLCVSFHYSTLTHLEAPMAVKPLSALACHDHFRSLPTLLCLNGEGFRHLVPQVGEALPCQTGEGFPCVDVATPDFSIKKTRRLYSHCRFSQGNSAIFDNYILATYGKEELRVYINLHKKGGEYSAN